MMMEHYVKSLPYFTKSDDKVIAIEKLSGGQQNTNYKVTTNNGKMFVCRIPGIDANEHGQTHQIVYHNSLAAHRELGVNPKPCYFDESLGVIVTEYIEGVTLSVSILKEQQLLLDQVISVIRSYHNETSNASSFLPSKACDFLFGYDIALLEGWCSKEEFDKTKQLQLLLKWSLGEFDALVSCHNDLTPANVIKASNGKIFIIDWEWSGPGDRIGDLATFCALSEQDSDGEVVLLAKYLGVDEPSDLQRARLHLWRIWFTLRGGLWALCKAKSIHFFNRDAAEITEDDDYEKFCDFDIKTFIKSLNKPVTDHNMYILRQALEDKATK